VTHSITFLPEVDLIVVLKNGTISEIGTYSELVNSKGAFNDYLTQYSQDINSSDESEGMREIKLYT
jgi:ABC-type transport system involved in cytochrome bd biosynthesis fused ATPase/permease subunit